MTTPRMGPPRPVEGYRVVAKEENAWWFVPQQEPRLFDPAEAFESFDEVGLATITVKRPVAPHQRVRDGDVQHVDAHFREMEIEVPDAPADLVDPPWIRRLDHLGEKARKGVDKYIADNEINIDGISEEILEGFSDPDLVRQGEAWYREEFKANAQKLADKFDVTRATATAVIAIVSARTRWTVRDTREGAGRTDVRYPNLEKAETFLRLWRDGAFDQWDDPMEAAKNVKTGYLPNKGFGPNVIGLLKGQMSIDEAVTGAKRRSFYDNGLFPETSTAVTNDVWMARYLANHSTMSEKTAQGALSGDGPAYLQDEGIQATPAYLVLAEGVLRAHERALAEGLVSKDWLPHQTQALAWVRLVS